MARHCCTPHGDDLTGCLGEWARGTAAERDASGPTQPRTPRFVAFGTGLLEASSSATGRPMMRLRATALTFGTAMVLACGTTSSAGDVDGGTNERGANDGAVAPSLDGGTADAAVNPAEDAGGRVANFDFGGVCTASWLSHDLAKPIRFAVELNRGTLPNNSPSVTLRFTPLRAMADRIESKQTVGSTLDVPPESIGGYDFFDAVLAAPNDALVLPASATPDGKIAELSGVSVYGYVPTASFECGWITGTLTKPTNQPKAQLRCLFYRANAPLPAPTQEDFAASSCAKGTYVW